MRILRWPGAPGALPKRPYRDTVLVYTAFAVAIVVFATLTGGGLVRGLVVAALFWAVACGYGLLTMRRRIERARRQEERTP